MINFTNREINNLSTELRQEMEYDRQTRIGTGFWIAMIVIAILFTRFTIH